MAVPKRDVLRAIEAVAGSSELVKAVRAAKKSYLTRAAKPAVLRKSGYKPLTPAQLRTLKSQGSSAEDWRQVWVGKGFDPKRVRGCRFEGSVLIGALDGTVKVDGVARPAGLESSTLASVVLGDNVLIRNVGFLSQTVVGRGAVIAEVGLLAKGKADSFANGLEVLVAVETGGREVPIFAEMTVDDAWKLARSRADRSLLSAYAEMLERYIRSVTAPCNVIGAGARVIRTPKVRDVYLGPAAVLDSAQWVEEVTALSQPGEETEISHGATVKSSILQWGCEVTTQAIVDSSLLTEHSHVERHGKVTHTILGPNTGVAEGEVTSALLGPFVGFHHQALLIAALWPEGKGNVGYGANIGSNHTAKAPDQEIWPGEGTFFGLGCNIKFPTDLTRSPYTIIASGVSMLPQRVEFPFSLINSPAAVIPGVSPAYNEIMPGWVLSDNIYMVKRNEGKYAKRNKAKRSRFVFEVFRPEMVDLLKDARQRLQVSETKEIYGPKEIRGLGKNYISERSRKKAIETYTFYIGQYALSGLKREAARRLRAGRVAEATELLKTPSGDPRWEHERRILSEEFSGKGVVELLRELAARQETIARAVQTSKEKDDRRGASVIEDYTEAHPLASEDSFVKETWKATEALKAEVEELVQALEAFTPVRRT